MRIVMEMKILMISILIGFVHSACPQGWKQRASSCYYFSIEALPWTGAQDYCKEFGGQLVEIITQNENTYLENIARQNYHPNRTATSGYIYGFWTGGKEDRQHGYWYWAGSGHKFTFQHWYPGEPNNAGENCMHVNSNEGYRWNDYICTQSEYFICEKSLSGSGQGIIG